MITATSGEAVNVLSVLLLDDFVAYNNPVTGQVVTVAIRRDSDAKWWNWVTAAWDTVATYLALTANNKQALTDNTDGTYSIVWNQATADASAEREYTMMYSVSGGVYQGMASEQWRFRDPAASGLDAQATRDSMKLAATAGAPAYGSLDALVIAASGNGDTLLTVTVTDGTNPIPAHAVTVWDSTGAVKRAGPLATSTLGVVTFALADATAYRVLPRTTNQYSGGAATVTLDGATAATCAMTAAAIPAPTSPDNYVLFGYERKVERDAPFGAGGVTVTIRAIDSTGRTDPTANAQRSPVGEELPTDVNGMWSIEVAKTLGDCRIHITKAYVDAAGSIVTERQKARLSAAAANPQSQIAWADLSPTLE